MAKQREIFDGLAASKPSAEYARDRVLTMRDVYGIGQEALDAVLHPVQVADYELRDGYNVTVTGEPEYVASAIAYALAPQSGDLPPSIADSPLQPVSPTQVVAAPKFV